MKHRQLNHEPNGGLVHYPRILSICPQDVLSCPPTKGPMRRRCNASNIPSKKHPLRIFDLKPEKKKEIVI